MKNIDEALSLALATLLEVMRKLAHGVNKAEFEREYQGRFVSPGVSVRRHVEELRITGSLEETNGTMKLRQGTMPIAA